jgi:hypothetical protein
VLRGKSKILRVLHVEPKDAGKHPLAVVLDFAPGAASKIYFLKQVTYT